MTARYVLALDEGSSSARAMIVDGDGRIVAEASNPITPLFPHRGWVELDPAQLWSSMRSAIDAVMSEARLTARDIVSVGVTTHRETCLIWDRASSTPVHNAIMWSSHQTDDIVARWSAAGLDGEIRSITGLRNDSFFSASKLAWFLENVPGVRERAGTGELAAGTVDTWLLWHLTGGREHLTDATSASRTALVDLATCDWDDSLLTACGVPRELLPEVRPSNGGFGYLDPSILPDGAGHRVPVYAIVADQQAGLFGQGCFDAGSAKNTFGTTGVLVANVGSRPLHIPGMTTSVAMNIPGLTSYEVEGVVFHSGQTLHWLRDRMRAVSSVEEMERMAETVPDSAGVYFVPAFAGLCDPYWDKDVRGSIVGLTLETGIENVVRAALEAMAYQTRDNIDALVAGGIAVPSLKVDGKAVCNNFLCQFQADILGIPVVRPEGLERTALGVAYIAGAEAGLWDAADLVRETWHVERIFEPAMAERQRDDLYGGWQDAVAAARSVPASARLRTRSSAQAASAAAPPAVPEPEPERIMAAR